MNGATIQEQTKEKLWTRDFILLTTSNFFLFFGFQMLLPTLPMYVSELGGKESEIGLVIGIFTISALLIRPLSGATIDIFGRKIFLFLGLIICLAAIGIYWLATTVLFVLLIRILHGIGWGISTTTFGTAVSDIIPPTRRGEGMGYFGMSTPLSMALAPVTGIWIINYAGFSALFFISFLSTTMSILFILFLRFKNERKEGAIDKRKESFVTNLFEKTALFPSLLIFLATFVNGGIISFITLFGKEVGIENVGWFFSMNALFLLLIRPISGKIYDTKGHQWVIIPGLIAGIISLFILSYTTSLVGLITSAIFFGISFGSIQPSLQAWLIERAEPSKRGSANATFFSAFDLGIGGGAMILGAIAGMTSYAIMYRSSIIMYILFFIIYGSYIIKHYKTI